MRKVLFLFMVFLWASGAEAQTLSSLSVGDRSSQAALLGAPSATNKYKSFVVRRWNLASGNDISITADGTGRIVYLESDWGGNAAGRESDVQGLVFGVTTLNDLRKRFGSNGFGFKGRGAVLKVSDGIVMINSYEIGKNVVTFFTKITDDVSSPSSGRESAVADRAKLDAISIADPEYAKSEWGDRVYDPHYKNVKWKQ